MRLSVHGQQTEVGPELREEVERRLYFALGRFADMIREARVHLTDVNGPRGGIDKSSRIVVVLKSAQQVVAEATDVTVMAAVDRTCYRVKRLVGRAIERQNEPPSIRSIRHKGFHVEE